MEDRKTFIAAQEYECLSLDRGNADKSSVRHSTRDVFGTIIRSFSIRRADDLS